VRQDNIAAKREKKRERERKCIVKQEREREREREREIIVPLNKFRPGRDTSSLVSG